MEQRGSRCDWRRGIFRTGNVFPGSAASVRDKGGPTFIKTLFRVLCPTTPRAPSCAVGGGRQGQQGTHWPFQTLPVVGAGDTPRGVGVVDVVRVLAASWDRQPTSLTLMPQVHASYRRRAPNEVHTSSDPLSARPSGGRTFFLQNVQ